MNLQNAYFSFSGWRRQNPWVRACLEKGRVSGGRNFQSKAHPHDTASSPPFAANGSITGGEPLAELVARLHPGITLLGGKLEPWRDRLESTGAVVLDYFQDELLTAANAAVTAEGAVLLAMEQLPCDSGRYTGAGPGWGRIGQLLSRKLQALGAQVTVSARRSRDLGMIRAMGFRAAVTGQWEDLSPYRVIFNTVPAPVLSQRDLESTSRTACFWSWPPPPAELRPVAPQLDPGLRPPGKTAPETAGRLIGETILRLAKCQERSSHAG